MIASELARKYRRNYGWKYTETGDYKFMRLLERMAQRITRLQQLRTRTEHAINLIPPGEVQDQLYELVHEYPWDDPTSPDEDYTGPSNRAEPDHPATMFNRILWRILSEGKASRRTINIIRNEVWQPVFAAIPLVREVWKLERELHDRNNQLERQDSFNAARIAVLREQVPSDVWRRVAQLLPH